MEGTLLVALDLGVRDFILKDGVHKKKKKRKGGKKKKKKKKK